jgi:hypothetical protein
MNNDFNSERALAGEPVVSAGVEVNSLTYFPLANKNSRFVGERSGEILLWSEDGYHYISSGYDLKMKPTTKRIDWTKIPVDVPFVVVSHSGDRKNSVRYHCKNGDFFGYGTTSLTHGDIIKPHEIIGPAPDAPFIYHDGSAECPAPDGVLVDVVSASMLTPNIAASLVCWGVVTAYRIAGLEEGWEW